MTSAVAIGYTWSVSNKGRSSNSDIKVNDISVSREHCSFTLFNRGVYLKDNDSKFGTLMHYDDEIKVKEGSKLCFQIGKHVVRINVEDKNCCAKLFGSSGEEADYNNQILERIDPKRDYLAGLVNS